MALQVKNIQEGWVDASGFHPIRAAADYKPKRVGETKKYATGKKRKVSKAKRTVTVAHVRQAAKKTVAQIKAALTSRKRRNPVSRGVLEIHDAQKQLTLYDSIKAGKSVTVRVRGGGTRSGRATMRGPAGWVLTPSKHTGNPPIAYPGNIVSVRAGKLPVAKSNPGLRRVKGSTSRATLLWYASKMPFYTTISKSGASYGLYVDLGNEAKAKSIIAGSSLLREAAKKPNPLPVGKYIKAKVKRCSDGTVKVMISR